jgi:hypothetical protein
MGVVAETGPVNIIRKYIAWLITVKGSKLRRGADLRISELGLCGLSSRSTGFPTRQKATFKEHAEHRLGQARRYCINL